MASTRRPTKTTVKKNVKPITKTKSTKLPAKMVTVAKVKSAKLQAKMATVAKKVVAKPVTALQVGIGIAVVVMAFFLGCKMGEMHTLKRVREDIGKALGKINMILQDETETATEAAEIDL